MNEPVKQNKGGRPVGSKSSDSIEYQAFLIKNQVIIPEIELWALQEAKANYENAKDNLKMKEAAFFLKLSHDIICEMATRVYPKLKSIELHQVGVIDKMTPQQKLEALKQAVAKQELEIKNGSGPV